MSESERRTLGRVAHFGDLLHREFMLSADRPEFVRDKLRDLSVGGVGFQSQHKYELGQLVEARLEINGWSLHASSFYMGDPKLATQPLVAILKVSSLHVMPSSSWKVGCSFESIDEGHLDALKRYLAAKSGQGA